MTDPTVSLYEGIARQDALAAARTIHYFDVPPKLAKSCNVKVLGFVQLNTEEELTASRRVVSSAGSATRNSDTAFELMKLSLRYVDGKKISMGDGSAEMFWGRMDPDFPKLRQLITTAHAHLHNVEPDDAESFLSSQRVTPTPERSA